MLSYPDKAFEPEKPQIGAAPYFTQPFTGSDLTAGVEHALRQSA
jgi:hypothetical protein